MMRAVNTDASRTPGSLRSSAHLSLQCATTRPLALLLGRNGCCLSISAAILTEVRGAGLHHRDLREPQVRVDDCERRLALRRTSVLAARMRKILLRVQVTESLRLLTYA